MKLLAIEGLTATRNGHVLLEQIRLEVRAGQVIGVISDTPGRLSLFLNIVGGVEHEQRGKVLFSGQSWSPKQRLLGVGIATEQVSLVDSLSVLDNLFLSNSRLHTRFGFILRARRRHHARKVLRTLGAQVPLDLTLQKVEPQTKIILDVARILIKDPSLYVFRGVTRGMSLRQYEGFRSVLTGLKAAGKGVILVPLNAEDVRNFVDRLFFLQGGQLFEVEGASKLTDEQLHAFFLGNEKKRYLTSNDPIQRAKQIIEESVAAPDLDFQDLAKTVGMSYDNFRRRFKQQVGVSPNQHFLVAKLDKAKELLLFTDLEIKDVALQLGFADPYYFSRFFKERAKISPVHFRQGEREEP